MKNKTLTRLKLEYICLFCAGGLENLYGRAINNRNSGSKCSCTHETPKLTQTRCWVTFATCTHWEHSCQSLGSATANHSAHLPKPHKPDALLCLIDLNYICVLNYRIMSNDAQSKSQEHWTSRLVDFSIAILLISVAVIACLVIFDSVMSRYYYYQH